MEEFKKKTEEDLIKLLKEKREALRKFRFDKAGARIKNTKDGVNLRKEVARLLTELGMRAKAPKANATN